MVEQPMPLTINQQVPVTSDEVYANYMQEERIRNMVSQTSPDSQLQEIQWKIKGYMKDPLTGRWEKINKDMPEPNPKLVMRFISYISSILNEGTRWGNYDINQINMFMKLVIEWVSDELDSNSQEYGLEGDYSEMTRIGDILLFSTFIVFTRGMNGMESKRIWDSIKLSEMSGAGTPQQKGFLDNLKFWK